MATETQVALRRIASVNPSTGEVLRQLDCASESDVRDAVEAARAAQVDWAAIGLHQRLKIIGRFQQLLLNKKSDLARLISIEAGKPISEALTTEILVVLDAVRFCIENAGAVLGERPLTHG